jgi:hypothetical protein
VRRLAWFLVAGLIGCDDAPGRSPQTRTEAVSAPSSTSPASPTSPTSPTTSTGATSTDRLKYRSSEGNFEVRFPYATEPKLETRPIVSGVEYVAKTQGELGTFLVGYDDTLKLTEPRAPKRVLDDIVKSTMAANHGKPEKETPLTLAGKHPGRAFESSFLTKDKKKVRGTWHLYVVRTRVYQVVALTPEDKPLSDADARAFFDSFALLTPR